MRDSSLKQEFFYLKGFVDGLKFNPETKEGEILIKLLAFLDSASEHVDSLSKELTKTQKALEILSRGVQIENKTQPQEDNTYEITCPNCGQKSSLPPQDLAAQREIKCSLCENIILLTP